MEGLKTLIYKGTQWIQMVEIVCHTIPKLKI